MNENPPMFDVADRGVIVETPDIKNSNDSEFTSMGLSVLGFYFHAPETVAID